MTRHYLDHASTSPLRPEAREALLTVLDLPLGDPGRIHDEGMTARTLVEDARRQVATLVGARSREVVFTSGATESIATAVWGASERGTHQVMTAVEHSAVRQAAGRAGDVTMVGVDRQGRVDPDEIMAAVRPDTALVHVQWGNHEVGTIQPVASVVEACRDRDVLVHVDAAQAVGRVTVDFGGLDADLMSVSAHKFGGPPGVGALLVRRGLRLSPLLVGGDQERARRAGHENTPAIVAFGAAAESLTPERLDAESVATRRRARHIVDAVTAMDGIEVYGPHEESDRLPHLVCLGIAGVEPQPVLISLDRAGIAVHSGSSCSSESLEPSPVLEAMGVDAHRSLRVSLGWSTTDDDVDALVDALPRVVGDLRSLAG
ncbi:MAG: cysteine desulfurase family protein [Acidimicrobiales bacterium]